MDFDSIGAFAMFLSGGAVGVGLILLTGFRMKLKAELEKLRLRGPSAEALDELREELQQALIRQSAEIDDLGERLDFMERLLTKGERTRDRQITPVS